MYLILGITIFLIKGYISKLLNILFIAFWTSINSFTVSFLAKITPFGVLLGKDWIKSSLSSKKVSDHINSLPCTKDKDLHRKSWIVLFNNS